MKKGLLLVVVMVFMVTAISAAFAGPFSDVPKKHWAYEAVNSLAAKGLLEGYADGKFKGSKAMTRYEMALLVARLIDKKFGGADLETLQKLTIEFADELALLGVKVQALEEEVKVIRNDVDTLKTDVDTLKKSGFNKFRVTLEDRVRFEENKYKSLNAGVADRGNSRFVNRLRMNIKGQVDDNVTTFISLQDSTVHGFATQNNPNNGFNNITAADTNRDLFLGYIDIRNFGGGHVIDNFRAGRFTLTMGKGFVLDNEVDGIMIKKTHKNTNYAFAALDLRKSFAAQNNNDGLDSKLFTIDHAWKNVAAGLYYFNRTSNYQRIAGTGNAFSALNMYGLTLDGKLGKHVVAFVEFLDQKPAKDKELYVLNNIDAANNWKGQALKLGVEWTINNRWDLTALYQERQKDFLVLGINDDYSDSAYYANGVYANCGILNCTFGKNGAAVADTFNNSKIAGVILGYKATEKLHLDVWYEDLKAKTKNAVGASNNFDQNTVQLIGTYQYRENTAFKLRYRTTKYKTGDADYVALGAGAPADHDQVRLDLNVKF